MVKETSVIYLRKEDYIHYSEARQRGLRDNFQRQFGVATLPPGSAWLPPVTHIGGGGL